MRRATPERVRKDEPVRSRPRRHLLRAGTLWSLIAGLLSGCAVLDAVRGPEVTIYPAQRILTMDPERPEATAVAVRGDTISATGTLATLTRRMAARAAPSAERRALFRESEAACADGLGCEVPLVLRGLLEPAQPHRRLPPGRGQHRPPLGRRGAVDARARHIARIRESERAERSERLHLMNPSTLQTLPRNHTTDPNGVSRTAHL